MVKLPNPADVFSAIDKAGNVIDKGLDFIDKASDRLGKIGIMEEPRVPETLTTAPESQEEPQSRTSGSRVSTEETIAYQKRALGKELLLLEAHLREGCRIPPTTGEPCDCCSPKHTVTIEALALETYGITGDPLYQELTKWAEEIERKTSIPEIESGRHNYGGDAVQARGYRKKLLGSESLGALRAPSEHSPGE